MPGERPGPGTQSARLGAATRRERAMTRTVRPRAAAASRLRRDPRALLAHVRDLLVDPVARVPGGDDLLEALGPALALLRVHRQRGVDGVRELLDVERVDGQRVLPELLVGAGVLGQDRHAVALVDQRPL